MKFLNRLTLIGCIVLAFLMTACNKTKPYDPTIPPTQVHFVGDETRLISINADPAPVVNVQVGTTDVSSEARTVNFNVTSPSGAVAGTQYTLSATGTVTIPANQSIADINIQPVYAEYATGRRDTLIFTLSGTSPQVASFQDTVMVILRGVISTGPCSEDNVDLITILGDYENSNEDFDGSTDGPYTTSISSATSTGPTTATIVVENIYNDGWGPITFDLDWTDPANRTCIVRDAVIAGTNASSIFGPDYDGMSLVVTEPFGAIAGSPVGTYSYCDGIFTLQMEIGIDGVGYYPGLFTVTMQR